MIYMVTIDKLQNMPDGETETDKTEFKSKQVFLETFD